MRRKNKISLCSRSQYIVVSSKGGQIEKCRAVISHPDVLMEDNGKEEARVMVKRTTRKNKEMSNRSLQMVYSTKEYTGGKTMHPEKMKFLKKKKQGEKSWFQKGEKLRKL